MERTSSQSTRRHATLAVLSGLCVARLSAGLLLVPHWIFAKYPQSAALWRAGTLRAEEGADFSPLYLLLNVLAPPTALRWLQAALAAACVLCAFSLGRRLLGPAGGWAAAILVALARPLYAYEATLEPDLLVCFLSFGGLWALVCSEGSYRSRSLLLWAGLLLGLSAAARPTGLLLLGLSVAALVVRAGWARRGHGVRKAGVVLAGGLAGLLVALGPVRWVLGSQLGATMSFGQVLHMGNRPEGVGLGAQPPALLKLFELQTASPDAPDKAHALYRRFARAALGPDASPVRTELYWARKALAFARREPRAFLSLLGRKLCFLVLFDSAHDLSEVRATEWRLARFPLLPGSWLAILGLTGAMVALLERRRMGWPLLYAGSTVALVLIFYVTSRHALPINLAWSLLGAGWAVLAGAPERRSLRAALGLGLGLCLLAARQKLPFLGDAREQLERAAASAAASAQMEQARGEGRFAEATLFFERAYAATPYMLVLRDVRGIPFESPRVAEEAGRLGVTHFGLGTDADVYFASELAAATGRCEGTLEALARCDFHGSLYDLGFNPRLLMARCRLVSGDRSLAAAEVQRALVDRPGTLEGLAWGVASAGAEGRAPDAARLQEELFALHDELSAREALARAYLAWGNAALALDTLGPALAALPESAILQYDRARILLALDRESEALDSYGSALALFPVHAFEARPFDGAVQRLLGSSALPAGRRLLAADHLWREGRLTDALRLDPKRGPPPRTLPRPEWLGAALAP